MHMTTLQVKEVNKQIISQNFQDLVARRTEPEMANKLANLIHGQTPLGRLVDEIFEPSRSFSSGLLAFMHTTHEALNIIRDQQRFEEEDEEFDRKCKQEKDRAVSGLMTDIQIGCESRLHSALSKTFVARNVEIVTFLCEYFTWVGICTLHGNRNLLIPYEGALFLNVHSLFYISMRYYTSADAEGMTVRVIANRIKGFLQDFHQFFPQSITKSFTEKAIRVASWFPYAVQEKTLPVRLHETPTEKKMMASVIPIPYAKFKEWLSSISMNNDHKRFFDELFLSEKEETGGRYDRYRPLTLPLDKTTGYRAVFDWPCCNEIVRQLDWSTLKDEFKTWVDVPIVNPGCHMASSWTATMEASVPFSSQLTQDLKIPSNFFFLNRNQSRTKAISTWMPPEILFPVKQKVRNALTSLQKEICKILDENVTEPLKMELGRKEMETVLQELQLKHKKKRKRSTIGQMRKRQKSSRK